MQSCATSEFPSPQSSTSLLTQFCHSSELNGATIVYASPHKSTFVTVFSCDYCDAAVTKMFRLRTITLSPKLYEVLLARGWRR